MWYFIYLDVGRPLKNGAFPLFLNLTLLRCSLAQLNQVDIRNSFDRLPYLPSTWTVLTSSAAQTTDLAAKSHISGRHVPLAGHSLQSFGLTRCSQLLYLRWCFHIRVCIFSWHGSGSRRPLFRSFVWLDILTHTKWKTTLVFIHWFWLLDKQFFSLALSFYQLLGS